MTRRPITKPAGPIEHERPVAECRCRYGGDGFKLHADDCPRWVELVEKWHPPGHLIAGEGDGRYVVRPGRLA